MKYPIFYRRSLSLCLLIGLLQACAPDSLLAPSTPTTPGTPSAAPTAAPEPSEPSGPTDPAPSSAPTDPSAQPTSAPSAAPTSMPPALTGRPQPSPSPSSDSSAISIYDYRQNFFQNYGINPFVETETDPLSTFAVDVDTAAYTLTRSYLNNGLLPPAEAVRTEEFINYFDYGYPQPLTGALAVHTELAPSYFGDAETRLLRVGLQGREVLDRNRLPAVLTLVVDVSGSMNRENRLELVKRSLGLLLEQLGPDDRVALVTFGSEARLQLGHTPVRNRSVIQGVIDNLRPEGSTYTQAGLELAYEEAGRAFQAGAINRVILCSDGVSNVGATGPEAILATVKAQSQKGISLTTLGFGLEGFNDYVMEQLANQGDGQYAYIDSLDEARRLFVDQLTSTLQMIAKDVKIQVGFDPKTVSQYRLLGYENRDIADEDFRNDEVDAGEVGSNHSVTALYEVRFRPEVRQGQVATVSVRYQDAADGQIKEFTETVDASQLKAFNATSASFKLAMGVAEFAEILRHSIFAQDGSLSEVSSLVQALDSPYDADPKVQELRILLGIANGLKNPPPASSISSIVAQSENPKALPEWQAYLLRQLGGSATSNR